MPEAPTTTETTTTTETAPWFAGFDDATKGAMQQHGWDKLDAPGAFNAAFKSFRDTQSKLGIPPDRVLRWPDANDADGLKPIYQRLGVPAEPAGYDFSSVKFADGTAIEDDFSGFMRETAHKLNIPAAAAVELAKAIIGFGEAAETKEVEANRTTLAAEQAQLDAEWGGRKAHNEFLVQRGAALLGYTPAELEAIKQQPGFAARMRGFLNVAQKMGEAPMEGNDTGGGHNPGPLTGQQAIARHRDIIEGRDKAFVERLNKGDSAAVKEWANLTALITRHRMNGGA